MLANPPFGVEWKKVKEEVEYEHEHAGRRRPLRRRPAAHQRRLAALPPAHDLEDEAGGRERRGRLPHRHRLQRLAAVHRRGRLRRVARSAAGSWRTTGWRPSSPCPDQLFYNTGISTYFWILTNRKDADHKGKVVLLDARDYWVKMRKSLGDKRKELGDGTNGRPDHIGDITRLYADALRSRRTPSTRCTAR